MGAYSGQTGAQPVPLTSTGTLDYTVYRSVHTTYLTAGTRRGLQQIYGNEHMKMISQARLETYLRRIIMIGRLGWLRACAPRRAKIRFV